MRLDDTRFITAQEAYQIHQSIKFHIEGSYSVVKYGLYGKKFLKSFDMLGGQQGTFRRLADNFQTELRATTYIAANIARKEGFVTEFKKDHYIALRKFNSSIFHVKSQCEELLGKYSVKDIFSEKILHLASCNEISKELFSALLVGTDLDDILLKSSQSYIWKFLRKSQLAYTEYVTVCDDKDTLIYTLENCLTRS